MPKEKFLLVSLKESKAKQLAQIISNDTCRKILDYLAEKEATESELSEKLNIPVSTVHYNLQHLIESGMVTVEEFHYSEKGKEVNHYKLANKYIIIAPKTTFGIKEKLKTVLPVVLLITIGAGLVQVFSKYFRSSFAYQLNKVTKKGALIHIEKEIASVATTMVEDTSKIAVKTPEAVQNVTSTVTPIISPSPFTNIALWFLIGGIFAIILYLLISKIREK
jgi:DNA-binding transcriptional ArsR family regulator